MIRLLTTVCLWLAATPAVCVAVELLPLSELETGAAGVCITEMDGGERVEIPVTVIGTIGSGVPGGDIVLVRLEDPRFEKTGIIAGMSGSPVYVGGRLLGALAYGWPFAKDPIGGVTPFERMLEMTSYEMAPASIGRPAMGEILAAAADGDLGSLMLGWLVPERTATPSPLPLVVSLSGGTAGEGWLAESWRRLGWVATAASSATAEEISATVEPGSMVAGVLVDGDVSIAAAGTVTEVRGNRLWAFGHPSLGVGAAAMPLAAARVLAVMPSLMSSFKFFTVGEPIGAVIADRSPGLVAALGETPSMVPIEVSINQRVYSFRAVRHPTLLPLLAAYLTQASHGAFGRTLGDQSIELAIKVRYAADAAEARAAYAGGLAPAQSGAFVAAVTAYLEGSTFNPPSLQGLEVQMKVHEELRAATIVEIVPDRRVVRPGEELSLRFRLLLDGGREEVRVLTLTVPPSTPAGRIDVVGADGAAFTAYDLQMRPFRPADFKGELELVRRLEPANSLVAFLERKDLGVAVSGGQLSAPPSRVHALRSALGANLETTAYSVIARAAEETPYVVTGAERISLNVVTD
jgi:hypothetical protein